MKTIFTGLLSKKIEEYMEFRKSLGFSMRNTAYVYAEFDNYLAKQYSVVKVISREMVINYLATTTHLHSTSRAYRVTLLRGFCRYLYQKDPRNYIPEPKLLPCGKRRLKPYIFTDVEITKILKKLRKLPTRGIWGETTITVIGLLAATGLRVGEACRLNLEDVDFKNKILFIRRSKFYKSRIVPISRSTVDALIRYKLKRLGYYRTTDRLAPFFVGMTGARPHENGISKKFRQIIRSLEIETSLGDRPRLHDLRHSFATHSLERIYNSGKDSEAHLSALATYLGHVNLDYTQTYLHPSIELLRTAGEKFNHYSKSI